MKVSHLVNDVITIQSTMKGGESKVLSNADSKVLLLHSLSIVPESWRTWTWNFANVYLMFHSLIYIMERKSQEHTVRECWDWIISYPKHCPILELRSPNSRNIFNTAQLHARHSDKIIFCLVCGRGTILKQLYYLVKQYDNALATFIDFII